MPDDRIGTPYSRRSFLNSGATLVAGGVIGGVAGLASGASVQPDMETAALPWRWAKIDPLEAGRRSFHNYHEKGG
jgi:hypothetical protein